MIQYFRISCKNNMTSNDHKNYNHKNYNHKNLLCGVEDRFILKKID